MRSTASGAQAPGRGLVPGLVLLESSQGLVRAPRVRRAVRAARRTRDCEREHFLEGDTSARDVAWPEGRERGLGGRCGHAGRAAHPYATATRTTPGRRSGPSRRRTARQPCAQASSASAARPIVASMPGSRAHRGESLFEDDGGDNTEGAAVDVVVDGAGTVGVDAGTASMGVAERRGAWWNQAWPHAFGTDTEHEQAHGHQGAARELTTLPRSPRSMGAGPVPAQSHGPRVLHRPLLTPGTPRAADDVPDDGDRRPSQSSPRRFGRRPGTCVATPVQARRRRRDAS